jgi:hypothetical protein
MKRYTNHNDESGIFSRHITREEINRGGAHRLIKAAHRWGITSEGYKRKISCTRCKK